jgi:uncharacterized membrane protein
MNEKLEKTVFRWLKDSGIKISRRYLDELVKSHPDYPSLACITDTLDELGIENLSMIAGKEIVNELPVPFLAHSKRDGGSFILIRDSARQVTEDQEFLENWDGIVVLLEAPLKWNHVANEQTLKKEKVARDKMKFGLVVLAISLTIPFVFYFSLLSMALLLVAVAGFVLSTLIVQEDLGISNGMVAQLCGTGNESGCSAVIHAKVGKTTGWFSWPDAGIVYFSSFVFLLTVIPGSVLLALIATAAFPFTIFSIYYQWRIIKRWCRLCLMVVLVLIMQFLLLLPALMEWDVTTVSAREMAFVVFIFGAIAFGWLILLKPVLLSNKELKARAYSLTRFKANPDNFDAILKLQKQVDVTPFENDLQLGNAAAAMQIIVACSPYCGPCASAHEILHELVGKKDIGLTVRFFAPGDRKEDKRTIAVEYLMRLLIGKNKAYKRQVMNEWYKIMDLEKFSQHYPINNNKDVDMLMMQHENWFKSSEIEFTPTVFINGYKFPRQYELSDLKRIIRSKEAITEDQQLYDYALN